MTNELSMMNDMANICDKRLICSGEYEFSHCSLGGSYISAAFICHTKNTSKYVRFSAHNGSSKELQTLIDIIPDWSATASFWTRVYYLLADAKEVDEIKLHNYLNQQDYD